MSDQNKYIATNKDYEPKLKWMAIYQNGETIFQYNEGEPQSSEVIDHTKLSIFYLIDIETEMPVATLHVFPGQKFFYRVRTVLRQAAGVLDRIHVLGWRAGESGSNDHCAIFVSEIDKSTEIGQFVEQDEPYAKLKPWMYQIDWKDFDEVVTEKVDQ